MGLSSYNPPKYSSPKESVISWDTWRKGLNTLLRENELNGAEMVAATNLLLVGSGVPTKRWGSQNYFLSSPTGSIRFLLPIKNTANTIEVLSLSDYGILTKKSGASYIPITGASWPTGYNIEGAELGGNVYLFSTQREMVKYNFSTLISFNTLSTPSSVAATNLSGATGTSTWSWRVTAIGKSGGETLASTAISLASLPQDLEATTVRLSWTPVSAASGDLKGYNVYRGSPGDEVFVGGVDDQTVKFDDVGTKSTDPFRTAPLADTTGGPKAAYVIRFQDRLVLAGIPGQPTRVVISGRYPQHERFDWYVGGGFVEIEPDSGESITGLGTYYQASTQTQTIIVFKERSVWELRLSTITFGNTAILDPQYRLLTASQGCSSHRSIVAVENDLMFANSKGIYILRYEPQLLNVINANELSAKIRPYFEALSADDINNCAAIYADKKYVLSFPMAKESIAYDRERICFVGPWPTPFGIRHWAKYVDDTGAERWIAADADDNYVSEFDKTFTDDKGTAIATIFKSKKEDLGDWTLFKTLNEMYMYFRSIQGSVNVNIYIEDRDGSLVVVKSFSVTGTGSAGSSGFGTDEFGLTEFGLSNNVASASLADLIRKAFIFKTARVYQVEIRTTKTTDNYELLGVKAVAIPQPRGNSPASWIAT